MTGMRLVVALLFLPIGLGCFARRPKPLVELVPATVQAPSDGTDALRVRLRFGAEADLDLHVTDPKQETVYFGNNPSLGGGVLERDLRCDDPTPRTEVVTFAEPSPGRYRVGVDFIAKCRRVRGRVPYEVEVMRGEMRRSVEGEIAFGRFQHIVLEFDL